MKFPNTGNYIRNLRASSGLTQKEFGEKLGIHSQFVSNAERGLCAIPTKALKRLKKFKEFDDDRYISRMIDDVVNQTRIKLRKTLGIKN